MSVSICSCVLLWLLTLMSCNFEGWFSAWGTNCFRGKNIWTRQPVRQRTEKPQILRRWVMLTNVTTMLYWKKHYFDSIRYSQTLSVVSFSKSWLLTLLFLRSSPRTESPIFNMWPRKVLQCTGLSSNPK